MKTLFEKAIEKLQKEKEVQYLNEYNDYKNNRIVNIDNYAFAINVLAPLCCNYFMQSGVWAKGKPELIKNDKNKSEYHRAAFKAALRTMYTDAECEPDYVLCKTYNQEKGYVYLDYDALVGGHYNIFATIIDDTIYYIDISTVVNNQDAFKCTYINGKGFLLLPAELFIIEPRYSAKMKDSDVIYYNTEYKRYFNR